MNPDVCSTFKGVLIYQNATRAPLVIEVPFHEYQSFIYQRIGTHVSATCISHTTFESPTHVLHGCELWFDNSLYNRSDLNQGASKLFDMDLYGDIIVVNNGIETGYYDPLSTQQCHFIKAALPPIQQVTSCQVPSKSNKRNRCTSPPPSVPVSSERENNTPFVSPNKDNSNIDNTNHSHNTLDTKTKRRRTRKKSSNQPVRRSSRLAKLK